MGTCITSNAARAVLVAAALAAVGGCKGRETARTDTATAGGAVAGSDTTARGADTGAAARGGSRGNWTDAQILAFASAANSGEIAEGRLAERKATNPAVKAFARQMVADHSAMLAEGKSFASKNNIRPDTTKDDVTDLKKDSRDLVKDLTNKKAGKDWDEDYIEHEIDGHKKVLDKLQDAEKATTNADLKAMLTKAVGKVQEHLTKAEDIKDNKLKT
jgi:putative membrane protein